MEMTLGMSESEANAIEAVDILIRMAKCLERKWCLLVCWSCWNVVEFIIS